MRLQNVKNKTLIALSVTGDVCDTPTFDSIYLYHTMAQLKRGRQTPPLAYFETADVKQSKAVERVTGKHICSDKILVPFRYSLHH